MAGRKAGTIQVAAGLFTLIGGGELVTMGTLGYVYGLPGIALFVGYAAAFIFLGFIVKRIRTDASLGAKYLSLPDYVHDKFGTHSGLFVFVFSFLAFFALLMLQFATAGAVITPLTGLDYNYAVLLIAGVVLLYLLIGGFQTVLITDVIQGAAMVVLLPLMAFVTLSSQTTGNSSLSGVENLSLTLWISFVATGFFVAAASADIWQRIYAAKSDKAAQNGLYLGGLSFLLFGFVLVGIGIAARHIGVTNPDTAFVNAITTNLPEWAALLAILMVLSAVMSTSDTELFLLTGMLQHELARFKKIAPTISAFFIKVSGARVLLILLSVLAVIMALFFTELVGIYTWLLSAIVVISPIVLFSLFRQTSSTGMLFSLVLNTLIFIGLVAYGWLTLENIYLISIPGIAIYAACLIFLKKSETDVDI